MSLEKSIDRLCTVLEKLADMAELKAGSPSPQPAPPADNDHVAPGAEKFSEPVAEEAPKPKGKGRPAGSTNKPKTPAPEPKQEAPKDSKGPGFEQVRAAMSGVQQIHGAAAAFKLLTSRNARTIKELPIEKFQEVIDAANKIVADAQAAAGTEELE